MTSSRVVAVAALLALLFPAESALAGPPSPQDFATARTLYKEGKDLRAAGDLRGAYEKLKAAHALGHTPLTGIELARTEVQLGLIVEAREVCLGIARMPVESDETDRSAEARVGAQKLAEELKPRIPSLRIHVADGAAIVTVDGDVIPPAALDQPRMVNPGHHVVTAHVEGGSPVSVSVDVDAAQEKSVELSPPHPSTASVIVAQPVTAGRVAPGARGGGMGALTVTGIVVTSVGVVVGSIAGIYAMSTTSSLQCTDNQCPPSQWSALDSAKSAATVSTLGFLGAGVGVVLLSVGVLTHTSRRDRAQGFTVVPDVGFGQIGLHGAF